MILLLRPRESVSNIKHNVFFCSLLDSVQDPRSKLQFDRQPPVLYNEYTHIISYHIITICQPVHSHGVDEFAQRKYAANAACLQLGWLKDAELVASPKQKDVESDDHFPFSWCNQGFTTSMSLAEGENCFAGRTDLLQQQRESRHPNWEKSLARKERNHHFFPHNFWAPNFFFEQNPLREITREQQFCPNHPKSPFWKEWNRTRPCRDIAEDGSRRRSKAWQSYIASRVSDIWRKCQENLLELMLAV